MNDPARRPLIVSSLAISLALMACDNEPAAGKTKATVQEAVKVAPVQPAAGTSYAFSQADSKFDFVGAKVTGKHDGKFERFQGTISVVDNAIPKSSVTVEVEIASLVADDAKLTGHLKSKDFFDAEKFPQARFQSTSITPVAGQADRYDVKGNLELHGVTKSIGFPATIRVSPQKVDADAEFAINRKDFAITYPGQPDDLIKDDVLLTIKIAAAPASS